MTSSIEGDVSMEGETAQVEVGDREEVSLADGAGISSANTVSDSMIKVACAANGELESTGSDASTTVSASVANDAEPHVEKGQDEATDSTDVNNGHDGSSKPQAASNNVKSGPSKKKRSKKKKGSSAGGAAGPGSSLVEGGVNANGDGREDGERYGNSTDAVKTADNSRAASDNSALGAQAPQSGAAGGNGAVGTGAAGNPATGAVAGTTTGGGIPSEEEIIRTLRNKELERRRAKAGGAQASYKEHK